MSLLMDRETAHRWRSAHTLPELGEVTALWLEGEIPSQAGYMPNCGPEDETLPHVEVLAAINRAGYVTDWSQPGHAEVIGYDRDRWCQRAAVSGFMEAGPGIERVWRLAAASGLYCLVYRPLAQHRARRGQAAVEVTSRNGQVFTLFGVQRDRDELWGGELGRRCESTLWQSAREVVVCDPDWGRNDRLWPMLAEFAKVGA